MSYSNLFGDGPLHIAATYDYKVMLMLMKAGANVTMRDQNGETPLHIALRQLSDLDNLAVLSKLIHPAIINLRNWRKDTPLHVAARRGEARIMEMLIKSGADRSLINLSAQTPLMSGLLLDCPINHEAIAHLIHPSVVDLTDWFNDAPLHVAARRGDVKVMEMLIKAGANLTLRNSKGETPLLSGLIHRYLFDGSLWTPQELSPLLHPSIVNDIDSSGDSALHVAARTGEIEIMEMLMKVGAGLTNRNKYGETPLIIAMQYSEVVNNSKLMLQLLPKNDHVDFDLIPEYVYGLDGDRTDSEAKVKVLSRLLLASKREDFFHSCELLIYSNQNNLQYDLFLTRGYQSRRLPYDGLTLTGLHTLGRLVRHGLGGITSLKCAAAFDKFKAEGGLWWANEEKSAAEIDGLFTEPLSLYEHCAHVIRDSVQGPKHVNMPQLPLPKRVIDYLMFVEFSRDLLATKLM